MNPIPVEIDVVEIIKDLNKWGWRDQKIEFACDFSAGYIAKLKGGARPYRPYQYVARLHNFWLSEIERRFKSAPVAPIPLAMYHFADRQTPNLTT